MTNSIKDMLAAGNSADDLLKEYKKQLMDAKAELDAEKAAEREAERAARQEEITDARTNVIDAIDLYADTLGLDFDIKNRAKLETALKNFEKMADDYENFDFKISASSKSANTKSSYAEIDKKLKDFLKSYNLYNY